MRARGGGAWLAMAHEVVAGARGEAAGDGARAFGEGSVKMRVSGTRDGRRWKTCAAGKRSVAANAEERRDVRQWRACAGGDHRSWPEYKICTRGLRRNEGQFATTRFTTEHAIVTRVKKTAR